MFLITVQAEEFRKEIKELRKVRAGFQTLVLPEGLPPTSSDVITRLNEHLLNVLSQLQEKEAELGQAQEALEKFQRKFSVIIHQQVSNTMQYVHVHIHIHVYMHVSPMLFSTSGYSLPGVQRCQASVGGRERQTDQQ